MNVDEMVDAFKEKGLDARVQTKMTGVKKRIERKSLWIEIERDRLKEIVEYIIEIADEFPHFSVISPSDIGESVELNYHFSINYGKFMEEIPITLKVTVPKNDLWVPTLTDIIPGTAFSEREIIEMMGVDVKGLEDKRHLFLTEDFPEGVYPWRRDETAPKKTNKLYEGWKE
ncbi:MAG: NADH-quinone oxidoreductase subunit C [Candidatus Thermoplasmatota archaeon]|nr:NADH-quinone oxidoreductase subunit C [Candidatus Thermoplasmatota archaeon]